MNRNIKAIDSLRESLNKTNKGEKKITLKEMIYNDEYEEYEDSPGYENAPELPHENASEEGYENKPIEKDLPSERTADPEIMDILSNIRMAVIEGLQKLAKKPQTVEYDTLKKILAIVDKPIDVANKEK